MSKHTHGLICNFGRHRGTPYTRIPISYLRWMLNSGHSRKNIAKAELKRRGSVIPDLELSGHAIDRASQRTLMLWQETRTGDEGLHAWLLRMTREALDQGEQDQQGCYRNRGMRFAIEQDGIWPVLKTVMPDQGKTT